MEERFLICPYCWQRISILLEMEEGESQWIEDCEVCCNPILFQASCAEGQLLDFRYERAQ
jgi:hypothetical protein